MNVLWLTGLIGLGMTLFGPASVRYVVELLKPAETYFPPADIQMVDRLIQIRTSDPRFSEDATAIESINYIIEVLTGTAE